MILGTNVCMTTYEGEGDEGAAAGQRYGSRMPAFGHERAL
jgi:hypothetical protein